MGQTISARPHIPIWEDRPGGDFVFFPRLVMTSWNCDLEMCMVEHSDIVRSLLPSNCSMPSSGQCNMCSTKIQDL